MYELVRSNINGRFAMSAEDADLLRMAIIEAPGDYIEIGTLWGASAIFAALVHKLYDIPGKVYAIDPMIGYYGGDDGTRRPTIKDFINNTKRFSVNVELVQAYSDPFPLNVMASVVLIDGNHSAEWVEKDWKNSKQHSSRFVIFHDYNDPVISNYIERIDDWKIWKKCETMAVLERKHV